MKIAHKHYYPFGMLMPGRNFNASDAIKILKINKLLSSGQSYTANINGSTVTLATYSVGYTITDYYNAIITALSGVSITATIEDDHLKITGWGINDKITTDDEYVWLSSQKHYRFGFNGKEGDDEVKGEGNQQDYGARIYNPRLGRFLTVDPIAKTFSFYTPYQFAGDKPTFAVDIDGLEEIDYRVLKVAENGTAYVRVQVTENTTSRSQGGSLLIHNLGSMMDMRTTPSDLLNKVLGIDNDKPRAINPNIKGGVGGTFTPQQGYSEYYLQFDQSELARTGVNIVIKTDEGNYINQPDQGPNKGKEFILSVPSDPAPFAASPSINLVPPGVLGYSSSSFAETLETQVKAQVSNTGQSNEAISNITVNFPAIKEYQDQLEGISNQLQSKYPNAKLNMNSIPVGPTENLSIVVNVTGSPASKLKVNE